MKKKINGKYTDKFKSHAVKYVVETGMSIRSAAKQLSMPYSTLSAWLKKIKKEEDTDKYSSQQKTLVDFSEVEQLKRELEGVKAERDSLRNLAKISTTSEFPNITKPAIGMNTVVEHEGTKINQVGEQWKFGDWDSLVNIDEDFLENHPDRARLALLVAASYQQNGDLSATMRWIRLAQVWGCSKKWLSQILISGIHNTLGRAALINGQRPRAVEHFEDAIRTVTPYSDVKLWGHARSVKELTVLGLLPQAVSQVEELRGQSKQIDARPIPSEAHVKVLGMEVDWLRERVYSLQKQYTGSVKNPIVGHVKAPPATTLDQKDYCGLHGLDKKLEAYIDYDNGYFVELGANDGISQSNTYYFEKVRGWRGVLIEPILHNYLKCKTNRSSENAFECVACVSFTYDKPHVPLVYSNLMTAPVGLESDITDAHDHAQSGEVYLAPDETSVDIFAPVKTLSAVLDEAHSPNLIDLLSLDVEGAEIEVLKGLDHQKYRIKYLLVECRDKQVMENYLKQHDYRLIDKLSHHDYLFADDRRGA